MAKILKAQNIHKHYGDDGDRLHVLRGISMEVGEGEIITIVGASGVGKSTLLHILGLLDTPSSGHVLFKDTDLQSLSAGKKAEIRNRNFGFVFQFFHLLPELSAIENVMLPAMVMHNAFGWFGRKKELKAKAEKIISDVGLWDRRRHKPRELSGGEKQRIAIARALMNGPEILFCDEPTGNLDSKTSNEIMKLLWSLNRQDGMALVIVTHNRDLARSGGRMLRMSDGKITKA